MSPVQVAEAYYKAFGKLDHGFMDACVVDKAGKGDIEATMNFFVISRVRQAYEQKMTYLSAEEWLAEGSPVVEALIYGMTDIQIEGIETDESDGTVTLRSRYRFWFPASGSSASPADTAAEQPQEQPSAAIGAPSLEGSAPQQVTMPPPDSALREDTLTLILRDGRWRISAIDRKTLE
jgi:hypothetical protein